MKEVRGTKNATNAGTRTVPIFFQDGRKVKITILANTTAFLATQLLIKEVAGPNLGHKTKEEDTARRHGLAMIHLNKHRGRYRTVELDHTQKLYHLIFKKDEGICVRCFFLDRSRGPLDLNDSRLIDVFQPPIANTLTRIFKTRQWGNGQVVEKSGYLGVFKASQNQWINHWVVLAHDKIHLSKSHEAAWVRKASISLVHGSVTVPNNFKHCFEVSTPKRTFLFSAHDDRKQAEWIAAIHAECVIASENLQIRAAENIIQDFEKVAANQKERVLQVISSSIDGVLNNQTATESLAEFMESRKSQNVDNLLLWLELDAYAREERETKSHPGPTDTSKLLQRAQSITSRFLVDGAAHFLGELDGSESTICEIVSRPQVCGDSGERAAEELNSSGPSSLTKKCQTVKLLTSAFIKLQMYLRRELQQKTLGKFLRSNHFKRLVRNAQELILAQERKNCGIRQNWWRGRLRGTDHMHTLHSTLISRSDQDGSAGNPTAGSCKTICLSDKRITVDDHHSNVNIIALS